MGTIISFFLARGMSQRRATIAAWLAAAIAAFALYAAVKSILCVADWFNDRAAVREAVNKANVETLETAREADDAAARQAQADQQEIDRDLKETLDAIEKANDTGQPSAAAIAHNCQRLRTFGFTGADLPEPCRNGKAAGR